VHRGPLLTSGAMLLKLDVSASAVRSALANVPLLLVYMLWGARRAVHQQALGRKTWQVSP